VAILGSCRLPIWGWWGNGAENLAACLFGVDAGWRRNNMRPVTKEPWPGAENCDALVMYKNRAVAEESEESL
jgi:hypothetical protein